MGSFVCPSCKKNLLFTDNKHTKKTTNKDTFKDNTKKVIPKGYEKKREGKKNNYFICNRYSL